MDKDNRPTKVEIGNRTYRLYWVRHKGLKAGLVGCIKFNGIYLTKVEPEAGDIQ